MRSFMQPKGAGSKGDFEHVLPFVRIPSRYADPCSSHIGNMLRAKLSCVSAPVEPASWRLPVSLCTEGSAQAGHHLFWTTPYRFTDLFYRKGTQPCAGSVACRCPQAANTHRQSLRTAPISEIHHCAPGHFCRPKQQLEWVRARSSSACLHTAAQLDVSLRPWHRRTQAVHYSAKGGH